MRAITVSLLQNLGTGRVGNVLDLPGATVGSINWEADADLTKIAPGDVTVEVLDEDGTIWPWIQTELAIEGGLLPPWLFVDVGGRRVFTGAISTLDHEDGDALIRIEAQDWSAGLGAQYLGAADPAYDANPAMNPWIRQWPSDTGHASTSTRLQYVYGGSSTDVIMNSSAMPDDPQAAAWCAVGDYITCDKLPGWSGYVSKVESKSYPAGRNNPGGLGWEATIPGLWAAWTAKFGKDFPMDPRQREAMFTRQTTSPNYFQVTAAVGHDDKAPVYQLALNSVSGIYPGDKLVRVSGSGGTWTVAQVDPVGRAVQTMEEVRDVATGDMIWWDSDSLQDLVQTDIRWLMQQAAQPYAVDFSRWTPGALATPAFLWLAMGTLTPITATMPPAAWTNPALEWHSIWEGPVAYGSTSIPPVAAISATDQSIIYVSPGVALWPDQLVAAPAQIMPDELATLTPSSPGRAHGWAPNIRRLTNGGINTSNCQLPEAVVVYDYLRMRRVVIQGKTAAVQAWGGNSAGWAAATTVQMAGLPGQPLDACVLPGQPGLLLVHSGTLGASGMAPYLQVYDMDHGTAGPALALSQDQQGALRTSPWSGAFLVTSRGYGAVTCNAGTLALQISYANVLDNQGYFLASTFCALDAQTLICLAHATGYDTSNNRTTETHLLSLSPEPAAAPVSSEKILEGTPARCQAVRDPFRGRILGQVGGYLWQFGTSLPLERAVARCKPCGMMASELLEHAGQLLNAVLVPDAAGVLHVISRDGQDPVQHLVVDRVQTTASWRWEHFYSAIRVAGDEESAMFDARGQVGGKVLEMTGHPFLALRSECRALAESMIRWFGRPRAYQEQELLWTDATTAPPWESIPPFARIRINEDPTVWRLMGLENDLAEGTAKARLVAFEEA